MKKITMKESFASTGKLYAEGELSLMVGDKVLKLGTAQVRIREYAGESPYAHVQIPGENRGYGVIVNIPVKAKGLFVKGLPEEVKE